MRPRLSCCCALGAAVLCAWALAPAKAFQEADEKADDTPKIAVNLYKGGQPQAPEKSMRIGITLPNTPAVGPGGQKVTVSGLKQLTFDPEGLTSNTCLKVDGDERLLGHDPGKWLIMEEKLGKDKQGKERNGTRSVWLYDKEQLQVTQTVEVVRSKQTGNMDACQVLYQIENKDKKPHTVGIRYLLDTLIGTNDGAPFIVPGQKTLCETDMDFKDAAKVPEFVQALERVDLKNPGVVAHLKVKMSGQVEAPTRLTLGAWPDGRLRLPAAKEGLTLWDVPVFSLAKTNDAAAVIYWAEKAMKPGARREVGFVYGLGNFSVEDTGRLGVTLAGTFQAGDAMTVLALVKSPKDGETLTLKLPEGLQIVQGEETQSVPAPPAGSPYKVSPVTWTVRPARDGIFPVTLQSSAEVSHIQGVRINKKADKE